eukprot:SAG31_NODE_17070_length_684_cov_1.405128_1_plen_183_part_01
MACALCCAQVRFYDRGLSETDARDLYQPPGALAQLPESTENLDQLQGVTVTLEPINRQGCQDTSSDCDWRDVSRANEQKFIDMDHNPDEWAITPNTDFQTCEDGQQACVTVDLGGPHLVYGVQIWHYYADTRQYCQQKIALSANNDFNSLQQPHPFRVVYDTGTGYGPLESPRGDMHSFTPSV